MEYKSRWKNEHATRTAFDELDLDTNEIMDIIRGTIEKRSKYLKRAELKPMAKEREEDDSHDTSRALHMRQTAEIAKEIARRLGLNEFIAYTGMLLHDAGHAFFGHEGEHTMNVVGKLLHVGYFHHNAKGIDVILSEDLMGKIVDAIIAASPKAQNDKELRKRLKEDAWYFLDVVVSHDGEASQKENKITKKGKRKTSIREAVLIKTRKANRENIYKCEPETLESILSKPSDVIAYIRSDMMDAFGSSIITKLDDDHFEVIGGILCETREEREQNLSIEDQQSVKRERIEKGKRLLLEYRKRHLRELPEDIDLEKMGIVNSILERVEKEGISILNSYTEEDMNEDIKAAKVRLKNEKVTGIRYIQKLREEKLRFANKYRECVIAERKINEILEETIEKYRIEKKAEGVDANTIAAGVNTIIEYMQKLVKERKRAVEEIMSDIQTTLIDDYVETTKENWGNTADYEEMKAGMGFSKGMSYLLYNKLKVMDYDKYVKHTKKIYQGKAVPEATYITILECARALVKTGVIRDKFYDPVVLSKIQDEEVKKHMKVPERDEEEYEAYKKKIGISRGVKLIRPKKKNHKYRFVGKKGTGNIYRRKLYKTMFSYVQAQDTRFAMDCEDVYYAIEHTVRSKVEDAFSRKFKPEEYLEKEQLEEMDRIRIRVEEIQQQLIGGRKLSTLEEESYLEKAKEEYIRTTIEKERENLEEKVAQEIAIKYIAGMPARKLKYTLIKIGNLSRSELEKQNKYKKGNAVVERLISSHKENESR